MATKFWLFTRDVDNKVIQTLSGPDQKIIDGLMQPVPDPIPKAGITVEEVSQAIWESINSGLDHPNGGGPRWVKQGPGSYVTENDTRPQLQITVLDALDVPKTEFLIGETFKVQFQVKDWQGNNITPNATRKIAFAVNGNHYSKQVTVVNGFKEISLSRNESGLYRVLNRNYDFHVIGDTQFEIIENLG